MRHRRFSLLFLILIPLAGPVLAQPIRLNGIDLKAANAAVPKSAGSKSEADEAEVLRAIQFSGPIQPEWLDALKRLGATPRQYLAEYAYLVTMPASSLDSAKRSIGITWTGALAPAAKINAALRSKIAQSPDKTSESKSTILVLSYGDAAAKAIEASGIRIESYRLTQMGWNETQVTVPYGSVPSIAAMETVFVIEEVVSEIRGGERAAQAAAGQYEEFATAPFGPGYVAWLGAEGLSGGENITVHVVDDGLDKGIATNLPGTAHADILGRIVGIYNATSDADGACRTGHGQIDAAIIVGNATVGTVDKGGYLLGQGIAPQASVYATKIFRDEGEGTDIGSHTYTELMKLGQDAGAIISNHSWGAPVDGAYTATSAEFDALVRDSDSIEAGNQQILYFFCAGNDGPDTGTTWSNANAKNVVSVGSHENSDADGYDGGNFGPMHADNIRDLSPGSSRGPTDDGRLGVTVVATGTHVQGAATTVNGYTGAHVSDKYWPLNQQDYARSSGTSHASPIACGAGIVVYEMFRDQLSALGHTDTPCPALIRAVLTNTATDIVGGSDGNGGVLANIPNVHQGWGAVNLDRLASMKTSLYSLNQTQVFTASGQNFEVTLAPMIAGKPMKITLAWTDVPGIPGAGTELVNDLDLRVIQGGQTFKGNVFSDGSSTTGGNADRKNTLEAVYLDAPSGAPVTVRVSAFNIAGDGIPNMGGALDQDFALFAWNAGAPSSTGDVNIFPAEINCDQEVTINLRDQDLAATALASVTVTSSTGDVEEVLLGETDSGTGLFTATFATNTGTPATNGMLEVAHNGSLTVTYDDANNANGQQVSDEAVVLVDCTPPIVSEVQVSNITSTSALISYSTNGPCDSKVRFGTACGTLSQFRGGGLHSVEHKAHLTGLTASTTYRFKIDASDTAGNMITAEDSGSCFSFATTAQPDYFTERFGADDNDIANQTLLFTPDGSVSHYGVCRTAATSFPTDPSAHTNLSSTVGLKNDSSYQVTLTDGKEFPIYGMSFTSFFINANGNITFGSPDSSAIEIVQDHYAIPRVAGLYDDLAPTNQKPVRYMQLSDRAVITWDRVPEEGLGGSNSFQVELFFDGQIRLTHLNIDATDGLVGLSRGLGTQSDWIESNMNAYAGCGAQTGSLLVQIRPKSARQDGARWRVDGGAWTKHNKSVSGLAAGSHTIEFKPIPGWHEPNDKQVNVAAGDETVTSGKYNAEK